MLRWYDVHTLVRYWLHLYAGDRQRAQWPPTVSCMAELKDNRPKWRQIFEIFSARIESGEYPPGSKIPTILEICAEFKVANPTAQKAVSALRDAGLIYTEYGMGSFVVEDEEAPGQ